MSRVGLKPVILPEGVEVKISADTVVVKGPKGELSQPIMPGITLKQEDNTITLSRNSENKYVKAKHGLQRTILANMVEGVTKGFTKELEVNGVGFKIQLNQNKLNLALGYSHPMEYEAPEGIELSTKDNIITVSGLDKQLVGQVAADIRSMRKPEPYKGKGIKYVDEQIIRKVGKAAAAEGAE